MNSSINLSTAEQVTTSITASMDPRLQLILARRRAGVTRRASVSTDADEIGVIARTSDATKWSERTDVRDATIIGTADVGDVIVTGRIPIQRIELIRALPLHFQPQGGGTISSNAVCNYRGNQLAANAASNGASHLRR